MAKTLYRMRGGACGDDSTALLNVAAPSDVFAALAAKARKGGFLEEGGTSPGGNQGINPPGCRCHEDLPTELPKLVDAR
jgi:hypothetical protein